MNDTILDFLKLLDIDYVDFCKMQGSQIKTGRDINKIAARFSIFKPDRVVKKVSIADVVGFSGAEETDLVNSMPQFFDRDGDGYHSRSASMLEIPSSEIMEKLKPSFTREPMHLVEVDKGIYNIGNNGMHRFHVLKMHYLHELSQLKQKDGAGATKLKDKYSFDAVVSELDFIKTYSAYVLYLINPDITVINQSVNWKYTGNAAVTFDSQPGKEIILSDSELIEFVKSQIKSYLKNASRKESKSYSEQIRESAQTYDSFKNYYESNLSSGALEGPWK